MPTTPGEQQSNLDDAQRGEAGLSGNPQPDPRRTSTVARQYLRGGDPSGASRVLDRVIKNGEGDGETYRLRSAARFQEGDYPGAYTDAKQALKFDPEDKLAADLAGAAVMQLSRMGLKMSDLKPRTPLSENLDRQREPGTLAAVPSETPKFRGLQFEYPTHAAPARNQPATDPLLVSAQRRLGLHDLQGALLDLTRLIDRDPRNQKALMLRAAILNRQKKPAAALSDAERALAISPEDPAALREKAYALVQLGRFSEALDAANAAVLRDPGNALGYLYRAMALQGLARMTEALSSYKRAAELDGALRGFYDDALAAAGAGQKRPPIPAPAPKGRVASLMTFLIGFPLVLFGIWGARRHMSGQSTTRPRVEPEPNPAPSETLRAGALLGGVYQVGRVIGRGGMGVVYEAEDIALQRKVAIKQLRSPDGSPKDLDRFLQEARLVARLSHPNIVQIHALVSERELLYLVFERIEGRTLHDLLSEKRVLRPSEATRILRDVAAALDAAHAARIIHRDLKPGNVMVTPDGVCKVMDFGIAHRASGAAPTLTSAWGTPPYMAPEQEQGMVCKESDLYALACTAYELLTGERPFAVSTDKLARRFTPPSRLGLPSALDAFMARALEPDATRRFHSGRELVSAYEACLTGPVAHLT
ncbi:MAG: protein kinase [Elusimicrobia bacterium]|nr:protein kinase [Elusimicrobiota bacterium]